MTDLAKQLKDLSKEIEKAESRGYKKGLKEAQARVDKNAANKLIRKNKKMYQDKERKIQGILSTIAANLEEASKDLKKFNLEFIEESKEDDYYSHYY